MSSERLVPGTTLTPIVPKRMPRFRVQQWPPLAVTLATLFIAGVVLSQALPRYTGSRGDLGSGTLPTWVAILLAALGLMIGTDAFRAPDSVAPAAATRRRDIVVAVVSLVVYLLVIPRIGFGFATILFLASQFYLLGRYSLRRTVLFALALGAPIGYLFVTTLRTGVPHGFLGWM